MKKRRIITNIAFYISGILLAFLFLLPTIWMIVSSFKEETRIFQDLASIRAYLPVNPTLNNYHLMLSRLDLLHCIWNSVYYIGIIMLISLPVNSMCGYALAKFEFKGKKILMSIILALMVFPFESTVISLFVLVNNMGFVDTRVGLILPFMTRCFSIYMFRQFFIDIPDEICEAAEIDGANRFRTFFSIVVPISGPVFATVFILDVVLRWSDFMWPLIIIINSNLRTVQLGIQSLFNDTVVYYGIITAALTIATLPLMILFIFFQKYYVQGISTTGMKG